MPRHLRGVEAVVDERHRGGGRLTGVVPAAEGADHHRAAEVGALAPRSKSIRGPYPTSESPVTIRSVTVAELRAGGEVEGVFACTRKDRLTARNGTPYLAVELRDRTGAIPGRAFRDADFLASQFERGDLVSVAGRVERFRDQLQVDLQRDPHGRGRPVRVPARGLPQRRGARRLPGAPRPRGVRLRPAARLLDAFLGDEGFRAELRRAPCTRSGHHAYLGGLLEHTVAVATLAQETVRAAPASQLGRAALRGDPPRRRQDPRVRARAPRSSSARRAHMLGHLTLGQQLVAERAARLGLVPGVEAERDLALHPGPPRCRGPARTPFPLRGGAGAVPAERARRRREGRARARALARQRALSDPGRMY